MSAVETEAWIIKKTGQLVGVQWIAGSLAQVTFPSGNTVYWGRNAFENMAEKQPGNWVLAGTNKPVCKRL